MRFYILCEVFANILRKGVRSPSLSLSLSLSAYPIKESMGQICDVRDRTTAARQAMDATVAARLAARINGSTRAEGIAAEPLARRTLVADKINPSSTPSWFCRLLLHQRQTPVHGHII